MSFSESVLHEHDHVLGDRNAPVTLLEYGDYQCPYCGRAHPVVQALRARFGNALRFAFRHFPLIEMHAHAQLAAEAAEAAGAQGRFWGMHNLLFENQRALRFEDLREYASRLGLDVARFSDELEHHAHLAKLRFDVEAGLQSGVSGTPTFFVDNRRVDEQWDLDTLSSLLTQALRAKQTRQPAATLRGH